MFFKIIKNQRGKGWFDSIIGLCAIIGFFSIFGPKFCSISTNSDGIVIETKEITVETKEIIEEVKKIDTPKQQKEEFKKL